MVECQIWYKNVSKTSNNIGLTYLQEMSQIYLASVDICDRTDASKHWLEGSTWRRGALSGGTLESHKRLVINVWETGPKMPRITPKAGKYLVPRRDTHLMSLPTI